MPGVRCEGGYVAGTTAFDLKGKKIKSVGGDSRGNHFRVFIDAVKAHDRKKLSADVEEGHLSSALCHLGNISSRLGKMQPLSKDNPFGDNEAGNESFERMRKHCADNKVGGDTEIHVGPYLKFDAKTERFTDSDEANKMLTRDYRKPYVVPDKV